MILRILHWISRLVLAGIFLYSGYIKLQSTLQFAMTISGYQLVPASLVFPLAQYLPWGEIALGLWLLSGWKIRCSALATAALLAVFIIALTVTYARGIEADCGCFGKSERITPLTIVRDMGFLLPAVFLLFENRFRGQRAMAKAQGSVVDEQS